MVFSLLEAHFRDSFVAAAFAVVTPPASRMAPVRASAAVGTFLMSLSPFSFEFVKSQLPRDSVSQEADELVPAADLGNRAHLDRQVLPVGVADLQGREPIRHVSGVPPLPPERDIAQRQVLSAQPIEDPSLGVAILLVERFPAEFDPVLDQLPRGLPRLYRSRNDDLPVLVLGHPQISQCTLVLLLECDEQLLDQLLHRCPAASELVDGGSLPRRGRLAGAERRR